MTPKPHGRIAEGTRSALASARAAARVPTANSCVDRCGWSRIDTLSLVATSPCFKDHTTTDEEGEEENSGGRAGRAGGGGGARGGGEAGRGEEGAGIFLTQLPPEAWEGGEEVGFYDCQRIR